MSRNEFLALCNKHCVPVELALENSRIREALKRRDRDAVRKALEEEF